MPRWFIALFITSLVGFMGSWSGDLVLTTSIMTFGIMLPFWYLAANLWWILLLMMPAMFLHKSGKGGIGLAIGAGVFVALVTAASVQIDRVRTRLTPTSPVPASGLAVLAGIPSSLEIVGPSEQHHGNNDVECGVPCQAVLTGPDIKWIRVQTDEQTGDGTLVYLRADAAKCAVLDPNFDGLMPCLQARKDDGARADLRIKVTQEGNFWGPMDRDYGLIYLTGIQRLVLSDQRVSPPQVLDERVRYAWSEPVIFPLLPGMTALGSGAKYDGVNIKRHSARSPDFDFVSILAHSGIRPGAYEPRAEGSVNSVAPYTTALLASILSLADDGTLSAGQSKIAREWLLRFRNRSFEETVPLVISDGERMLLKRMMNIRGDYELERDLTSLMGEHPDYFFDDFGSLLRIVVDGTPQTAERAAKSAAFALFKSKRGDHDDAWTEYAAAIESGRSGELIRWIGRFNKDPLPLLNDYLLRTPRNKAAWEALSAVCHVDERWWVTLAPFYHETAIRYLPSRGDPEFNSMEIHYTVRGLILMGRADLAEDVLGKIDWSVVEKMPQWSNNPASVYRTRESLIALPDQPSAC